MFTSLDGLTGNDAGGEASSTDSLTSTDAAGSVDSGHDTGSRDADADVTSVVDSAGGVDVAPANDSSAPETAPSVDSSAPDTSYVDSSSPVDSSAPVDSSSPPVDSSSPPVDAGSVYAATVLSDSPLAYWRVDEASGTTAFDLSGNGNDATYTGNVTLGQSGALIGDPDTAVKLDGASGYIDVGNTFNFVGNAAYTLEIWAQPENINTSYQRLFSRENPTSPREGYLVFARVEYAADPSTFSMERWASNATDQCPQTTAITQVWHHFVATYDGSTSRIYLDGALTASQPAPIALNATSASLFIGASAFDSAAYFNGLVDEVAVYGAALSATRIAAHYHASGR